jgi:hypothetical protein
LVVKQKIKSGVKICRFLLKYMRLNMFSTQTEKEGSIMDILNKVKAWAGSLAEVGVSLAALAIVLEVLGMGNMPFMPAGLSVVDNVSAMLASLGAQGVMGLIAIWVLWSIWERK